MRKIKSEKEWVSVKAMSQMVLKTSEKRLSFKSKFWAIRTKRRMKMTMLRIRKMRISKCRQISTAKCIQMSQRRKVKASKTESRSLMKRWETLMIKKDKLI